MEDEFESSARLLPPAEEKQTDSKLAAETQSAKAQPEAEISGILLPPAVEENVESMLTAESEPAESQEENQVFQMQLLFTVEEEQTDSKLAAKSEPAQSQERTTVPKTQLLLTAGVTPVASMPAECREENQEENKVPETELLLVAEDRQAGTKPADSNPTASKPAECQEAKVPKTEFLPVAEEKLVDSTPAVASKPVSSKAVEKKAFERPFRVKLRGSVLVLVRLPNKRSVRAAIHQLSTSGGVIHFEKPLDEKLEVELIFSLQKATIRGKAQMLFPMWATQGWMQPFRFVNLAESSRGVLDEKLKSFLGGEAKGAAAGA